MRGQHGAGGATFEVSAILESALVGRLDRGGVYDDERPVQFYSCSDGIVVDIPLKKHDREWPHQAFNFSAHALMSDMEWLVELKKIFDATAPSSNRQDKGLELMADVAVLGEERVAARRRMKASV